MATRIDAALLDQIRTEWRGASHGRKRAVIERWACVVGCDEATLYRHLPKTRERKGERKIQGLDVAARIVAAIKNSPPEHHGVISTRDALEIALINGRIDKSFSAVPFGTFDREIRRQGINTQRRRVEPFQAEYPNEMHHVDASTSKCLYIAKALPDGDFLLKLHKGHKDYKNKPIPVDGLRPWIYGMTDDHSGCHCCRYVAARGEQATHNMEFLAWAWWQQPDKCFWGVPSHPDPEKRGKIKGDHGPMMESPIAKAFFDACEVEIDPSEPLNKDAHGKVERPWRTLWQSFELPFFAMTDWKRFEITMSELNAQLIRYSAQYNERRHRYERTISRKQAWERISRHGGVVCLPDDALETIAKSNIERTVGQDGVFWLDNIPYEVKGLHDAKVKVVIGVFDKTRIVARDLADGKSYEVEAFAPNRLGEYTATPETGQQRIRKEAELRDGITVSLYSAEGRAALAAPESTEPRKVLKMPTRVKGTLKLHNPLNIDTYHSVEEALAEFQALAGFFLDRDARAQVAQLVVDNKLSRRFVAELAGEIQAEQMAM